MARKPELNKPQEAPKTIKCKYAGDPSDEYCKACNGYTMKVEDNGPDIPCTECGGYEPGESDESSDTQDQGFMNIPDGIDEELPVEDEKPAEPVVAKAKIATAVGPETKASGNPIKQPMSDNSKAEDTTYQSKAVVTEIRADSGLSCELQDKQGVKRWYKFNYGETRSLPADADYEAEVQKLWDDVNGTVDDQLQQTVDFLNS